MLKVALVHNLKKPKSATMLCDCFSEFDSPETVEAIVLGLRLAGHEVFLVEADEKLFDWLRFNRVDIVFNIAEGISGTSRESQVPAILDFLGIPYTGSGVLTLALSLDKALAKQIFIYNEISTPRFQLFKSVNESLKENLSFPLIVKPNCEGSAKGIHACSLVKNKPRLYEEIKRTKELYQQDVLVEEFIEGVEVTVGILGNQELNVLPLLEIDFSNCKKDGESFYSWEVKEYQGIDPLYPDPRFFCPARLSKAEEDKVKKVAVQAHRALGCLDVSRVDIRLSKDLTPYVLEVNPLTGLDPKESNLTRMAQACEMSYPDLINGILESALKRYQMKGSVRESKILSVKES
ncbi:MAG: ATP-grasp domain-containing protein [Candidatus Omnitrophica bacterium]|nr:ATP-grasp domain-containing protein [Candidatus Omnitrophota bacterium]